MTDEEKKELESKEELIKGVKALREKLEKDPLATEAAMKAMEEKVTAKMDEDQKNHDTEIETLKEEKEKSEKEMKDALDKLHVKVDRLNMFGEGKPGGRTDEQKAQMAALTDYARDKHHGLAKHDEKTYVVGTDAAAGHLVVPPYFDTEIIDQARLEITPALALAKYEKIPANQYEVPTITGHAVATWSGETTVTVEDTTMAVGKETIRPNYMNIYLKTSRALVVDSAYNIEGLFKDEAAKAAAKLLGSSFCTGATVYSLEGITINATIVAAAVASGSATNVTADGLLDLLAAPKTNYTTRAKLLMRRATLFAFYKLKDGQGDYLFRWNAQMDGTVAYTLSGVPVVECADMPAIAGAALPIAYGDFVEGYKIVDVEGMSMINDPYSSKTQRIIEYMFYKRIGGKVTNPEAIYVQSIA